MNKRLTILTVIIPVAVTVLMGWLGVVSMRQYTAFMFSLTPTVTLSPTVTLTATESVMATYTPYPTYTPLPPVTGNNALIQQELTNIQQEIVTLQQKMDILSQNSNGGGRDKEIEQIQGSLNKLNRRLETIETVILDSPAKALEITFLRQEIENTQKKSEQDLTSIREEIGRMYDLNKWFLALMFSMAISLVGLAVNNFLKINKPSDTPIGTETKKNSSRK
jgi:hypothetical protein